MQVKPRSLKITIPLSVVAIVLALTVLRLVFTISIDGLLYGAASHGQTANVIYMLKLGADPNTTDGELKVTALMMAAQNGHLAVTQVLLEHGASLNLQDDQGYTALSYAKDYRHPDVEALLRRHGATH